MTDSTLALISTLAWVALVGVLLGLFANPDGGAWSIASGVARGVRSWAGQRRDPDPPPRAAATSPSAADRPEVEDLL